MTQIKVNKNFENYKKNIDELVNPLGFKYEDLDIIEYSDDDIHRAVVLNKTRIVKKFAYRPYWIGNKFRLFKYFNLLERKRIIAYKDFDCGWTYSYYMKDTNIEWVGEKIL